MLSRIAASMRTQGGKRLIQQAQSQRRNMGGGGAFMETNKFGENLGNLFGTICWLWVFHRFRQDGAVLLGYQHPWEHGHDDDHQGGSHGPSKKLKPEEVAETWQNFSERSTVPGDDDDDDDDDDEDDE